MDNEGRQFDVVVWGASGFTGRLVVEYLLERYPQGERLRWAIAGRDQGKLERLLVSVPGDRPRPSIILADSRDRESLDMLTGSTRVLLTTVGPYAKYGSELVESCVKNGTHYCDLCGEVQWMREMIDRHQDAAVRSGAKIVMSCGFDSIPSDMGVWYLQQLAWEKHGAACVEVTLLVRAIKGGASGGTYASMLNAIKQARNDKNVARILLDPYALNPDGQRTGPDRKDQRGSGYNADMDVWTAPFVMAGVNTRVVRRSHALSNFQYGKNFRYHEATIAGPGLGGRLKSMLMSFGLTVFMIASAIPFTRTMLLQKMLPKPGDGPSRHERENGYFNLLLIGKLPNGELMRVRVKGDRDPGYGSTSKMLAESAVCLALDDLEVSGGLWTPSTALGAALMRRLIQSAGLTFDLE